MTAFDSKMHNGTSVTNSPSPLQRQPGRTGHHAPNCTLMKLKSDMSIEYLMRLGLFSHASCPRTTGGTLPCSSRLQHRTTQIDLAPLTTFSASLVGIGIRFGISF